MSEEAKPVGMGRKILAGILDVITSFGGIGYIIAKFTGNTTENGFQLNGMPAIVLFALIAAYFILLPKYAGGTIWQRILRTRR